jgi:hypothetical protein
MQFNRKIFSVFFLISLFAFSAKTTWAQYPGMGAFRAQQSREFANQQMQTQMQMQMNMMNWRSNIGQGTAYQVTFKDSSVVNVISFLYTDTVLHKDFLVYENKKFHKSDSAHRYQKIYSYQPFILP